MSKLKRQQCLHLGYVVERILTLNVSSCDSEFRQEATVLHYIWAFLRKGKLCNLCRFYLILATHLSLLTLGDLFFFLSFSFFCFFVFLTHCGFSVFIVETCSHFVAESHTHTCTCTHVNTRDVDFYWLYIRVLLQ